MQQLEAVGAVICAAGVGAGAGRQEALRAARRHRHRRGDPADRQLDHEQEDRRGHRRAGARRQGRQRRLHEDPRERHASWPARWSTSAPTPASTPSRCSPTCPRRSGLTAGNALEVRESVEVLAGGGPGRRRRAHRARWREEMLDAAGRGGQDVAAALADGRAMDAWRAMIAAQGGDPDAPLPVAAEQHEVRAERVGRARRARRVCRGRGRLAARRGPGPQGGPGAGGRRHRDARQAGRPGARGRPAARPCTPTSRTRFDRALDALQGAIDDRPEGTTVGRTPHRHRPDRLTQSSRLRATCTRFSHPGPREPCVNRTKWR